LHHGGRTATIWYCHQPLTIKPAKGKGGRTGITNFYKICRPRQSIIANRLLPPPSLLLSLLLPPFTPLHTFFLFLSLFFFFLLSFLLPPSSLLLLLRELALVSHTPSPSSLFAYKPLCTLPSACSFLPFSLLLLHTCLTQTIRLTPPSPILSALQRWWLLLIDSSKRYHSSTTGSHRGSSNDGCHLPRGHEKIFGFLKS